MTENKLENQGLDSALYALPDRIARVLEKLPLCIKKATYEIRLRANRPITLTMDRNFFVSCDAVVSTLMPKNPLVVSEKEIKEVIMRICDRSVYAKTEELKNGYISMKYGNRAGVCGSFKEGIFCEVSSVNIRIARNILGAAQRLYDIAEKGLLIAGAPGSGKTTILRDLIRHISSNGKRVCVVDTRGEIAALNKGTPSLNVGVNTDVISGVAKEKGLEIAVRTMFPDIVAFDEIANKNELESLFEGFFAGITIIATAHIGNREELMKRSVTSLLIKERIVGAVALLPRKIGGEIKIISTEELIKYA